MMIEREMVPECTLEQFADRNGLIMRVCERASPSTPSFRFYACFKGVEVVGDGVLIGEHGDGATEQEAIRNYAKAISLKMIRRGMSGPNIEVPRLVEKGRGD